MQAGNTLLIKVGPHSETIIAVTPSAPAVYWVFDPQTATLDPTEHRFDDDLKIDFASLIPSLDPDGISYNRASSPCDSIFIIHNRVF